MLTRIGNKVTVGRPLCNVLRIGRPLEGGGSFLRDWTVYGKSEVVGSSVLGVGDVYPWNQLLKASDLPNAGTGTSRTTYTQDGLRVESISAQPAVKAARSQAETFRPTGHRCLMLAQGRASLSSGINGFIGWSAQNGGTVYDSRSLLSASTSDWTPIYSLYTVVAGAASYLEVRVSNGAPIGDYIEVKDLMFIDLTAIFGEGNEPSTVDEFKAWLVKVGKMAKVTDDIPYFPYDAGSTFTSLPIVASSRNLFDAGQPVQSGKFPNSNGTISANANYRYLTIAVKPNTNYTIKNHLAGFTGEAYAGFVQSKEPIAGDSCRPFYVTRNNATTRNSGAYGYLMIAFWYSAESTLADIQVEEGTTATEFVTHQSQRFPLVISSPLHGIGDVRDIMRYSDHGITRKYGVVDLGTLTWSKSINPQRFESSPVSGAKLPPSLGAGNCIIAGYTLNGSTRDKTFFLSTANASLRLYDAAKYETMTADDFKAAMSGVLLVYELETPTFEPVTLPKLPAYRDGTVLYTDTQVHGDTIAGEAPVGFSLLPPVTMTPPTGDEDTNRQTDDTATE